MRRIQNHRRNVNSLWYFSIHYDTLFSVLLDRTSGSAPRLKCTFYLLEHQRQLFFLRYTDGRCFPRNFWFNVCYLLLNQININMNVCFGILFLEKIRIFILNKSYICKILCKCCKYCKNLVSFLSDKNWLCFGLEF